MCGLFGTFGPGVNGNDVRMFYEGLQTILLRGPHSTGMGWWDTRKPGIDWVKTAQNSVDFLQNKEVRKKLEDIKDPLILMGHARFATRGNIIAKNAHPFQHGKTLLSVNGTLTGIKGMDNFGKFEVDSEAACWHLNKHGLIPTLKALEGPYAFSWIDENKETFNIVRNWGRDLFYAKHPHRNVWYYSSEAKHLDWILSRNENGWAAKRDLDIRELKPHHLLQFRFNDRGNVHLTSLEKEIWPNFQPRSIPMTTDPEVCRVGGGAATRTEDDETVVSGADLDEQFASAMLRDQQRKWNNYNVDSPLAELPKVVDLASRRKTGYGHFDGPKGPPEKYLGEQYGVKVGDWIRVKLIEFSPYAVSKDPLVGKAVGEFDGPDSPDVYINAHSIDLTKWKDKKFEPGYYACRVSAISWVDQHESYAIHVNDYRRSADMPNVEEPKRIGATTVRVKAPLIIGSPILSRNPAANEKSSSQIQKCPVGMTKQEFGRLTPHGCVLCNNNLHHHKKDKVWFIKKVHPLCTNCMVAYRQEVRLTDEQIVDRVIQIVENRIEEEDRKKREGKAAERLLNS